MDFSEDDQMAMDQAAEIWKHILPQSALAQLQAIKSEQTEDDRKNTRQKDQRS